jgi:hypothetical protein
MADLAPMSCGQGWGEGADVSGGRMIEKGLSVQDKDDISALTFMANLASKYRSEGRGQEAEELGTQVMEASSTVRGEKHADTTISLAKNGGRRRRSRK